MQAETHKHTQTKTDPGGKTFVGVRVHHQSPGSQREASCYHLYAEKMIWQALWHIMPLAICRLEYLMATRNVVLPDPLEQDINELVETGRYQNRSEVIRAGLRLLLQQEAQNSAKLEALRNATSSGLMQLERGEYDEITSDDLAQYLDELGNQASH